jgi:hypothetical protein
MILFCFCRSYFFSLASDEHQIERYGRDDVDKKPAFEIMQRYFARMRDDLVVFVHISSSKIN